jgi:hypothetical protein
MERVLHVWGPVRRSPLIHTTSTSARAGARAAHEGGEDGRTADARQ